MEQEPNRKFPPGQESKLKTLGSLAAFTIAALILGGLLADAIEDGRAVENPVGMTVGLAGFVLLAYGVGQEYKKLFD